ncbi:hypothetical protein SAICODRAFT_8071 [Saitoella complicata NRRL Y-17804]|uniref:Origin recognition complex subunit 5 C-terminal domain-containing protein n=1 Tax=Saitoella complicata (strain BCRC 22490 / CBS 7301 / JCM 7358 / NBRC 10748 / NRRL Y-17804) TaxID=698492 RepID=A0A0E9N7Z7_SAICN|nr:uncharacterized protein SAICODRAFT_8071 [Saitoella complicata NRRL Y-17804]ODQ52241.1 hypothetical protein SAICODRAFT_8071 [Saitoella complicata NRRL Y-17804]GAO45949.1 hypothetical protein G7K_0194-t1 [Saitoella complicata NRRL Y-17804]
MLPNELLASLIPQYPTLTTQLRTLTTLLSYPTLPSPPSILLYGPALSIPGGLPEHALRAVLEGSDDVEYRWINCVETITPRLIFEAVVGGEVWVEEGDEVRSESLRMGDLTAFVAAVRHAYTSRTTKIVLVFSSVHLLTSLALPTLLQTLTSLSSLTSIPTLTTLLLTPHPPRHLPSQPSISFPTPPPTSLTALISSHPFPRVTFDPVGEDEAEWEQDEYEARENAWWEVLTSYWPRFVDTIQKTLGLNSAELLQEACGRLWPRFLKPLRNGRESWSPGTGGTFMGLYRHAVASGLFRGEDGVRARLIPGEEVQEGRMGQYDLPYTAKMLLIAAFLASYNPARLDARYFSKGGGAPTRRRKGGAVAKEIRKHDAKIPQRLLGPRPFPLERMLAIFHSLLDEEDHVRLMKGNVDVSRQVATLGTLRLMVKTGAGDGVGDGGGRWRVNVGWEVVRGLGRGVGIEVERFLAE